MIVLSLVDIQYSLSYNNRKGKGASQVHLQRVEAFVYTNLACTKPTHCKQNSHGWPCQRRILKVCTQDKQQESFLLQKWTHCIAGTMRVSRGMQEADPLPTPPTPILIKVRIRSLQINLRPGNTESCIFLEARAAHPWHNISYILNISLVFGRRLINLSIYMAHSYNIDLSIYMAHSYNIDLSIYMAHSYSIDLSIYMAHSYNIDLSIYMAHSYNIDLSIYMAHSYSIDLSIYMAHSYNIDLSIYMAHSYNIDLSIYMAHSYNIDLSIYMAHSYSIDHLSTWHTVII